MDWVRVYEKLIRFVIGFAIERLNAYGTKFSLYVPKSFDKISSHQIFILAFASQSIYISIVS